MPIDLLIEIIADAAPELLDSLAEEGFNLAEMGLDQVDLDDLQNLDMGEFSSALSGTDLPIEAEGIVDVLDGDAYTENFYQTINEGGIDNDSYIESVLETDEAFIDETLIDDFTDYPELNNFELSGFGNAEVAQQALFESVPVEHLESISAINYDPNILIDPDTGGQIHGFYLPPTQEIFLYNADSAQNIFTFQHEVGHHLLEQTPELQDSYLEARAVDATSQGEAALLVDPSYYEKYDYIHESFANDYARYLNNPEGYRKYYPIISDVFESTLSNSAVA